MLTPRKIAILRCLRRYFFLRASQIRDLVIPHDKDASITRDCLRRLHAEKLVHRNDPRMVNPLTNTAPPIYVLTQKGSCELAAATNDCSLLLTVEPNFRDWMSLNHYCGLSSLHILTDAAFAAQTRVRQTALYFEHEVINPEATDGQRYRLHTAVSQLPPLFCCPDSAFETDLSGHRRAWYCEYETGSDGSPKRVVAKKHKGYAGLGQFNLFKRHFPQARDFRVIAFCPNASWREAMRREIKGKPGCEYWLFVSLAEVKAETFLSGPHIYSAERGPFPLIPPASGAISGG